MKILVRLFPRISRLLHFVGKPTKVVRYQSKINGLENNQNFEEARKLRLKALNEIPFSHQGPLLRSEGEDKLYRLNDFQGALIAFERAVQTLEQSSTLYGVSAPDRIYGGAAQAAIGCNSLEQASRYYDKFKELVEILSKDNELGNALSWHRKLLRDLECRLFPTDNP